MGRDQLIKKAANASDEAKAASLVLSEASHRVVDGPECLMSRITADAVYRIAVRDMEGPTREWPNKLKALSEAKAIIDSHHDAFDNRPDEQQAA